MSALLYNDGKGPNVWLDSRQILGLSSAELSKLVESLRKPKTAPTDAKDSD